jgi:predicted Zn-dependent protease
MRAATYRMATASLLTVGCTEGGSMIDGFNIFTIEEDMEMGRQLRDEIAAMPDEYPILDEAQYPDAYNHIYAIRDSVLSSGDVQHAGVFDWETYIVHDDETLNAFAAPGGYIYVYTGLIRFLEHEDELAGVMGHEIAHADLRHSTQQLTKAYGIQTLISLVLGDDPGLAAEIAQGLISLSFSREDESESDDYSVRYLCDTDWASDGAAGFFEKLDGLELPEFLSTHPSSSTRVEDIRALAGSYDCSTKYNPGGDYAGILSSLP